MRVIRMRAPRPACLSRLELHSSKLDVQRSADQDLADFSVALSNPDQHSAEGVAPVVASGTNNDDSGMNAGDTQEGDDEDDKDEGSSYVKDVAA